MIALMIFQPAIERNEYANIRNEFIFSDVHGAMNGSGSLAKFGIHSLCTRPTAVHSSMNIRKMKFIS